MRLMKKKKKKKKVVLRRNVGIRNISIFRAGQWLDFGSTFIKF